MEISFSTAQNGLFAANFRQGAIADNLSNLTTDGFKKQRVDQGTLTVDGTRIHGVTEDMQAGPPRLTGRQGDFYVEGEGFFQVQREGAVGYTRMGAFHVDTDGNLVTAGGYLLEPNITVPDDSRGIEVTSDGVVLSMDSDNVATEIGQLELTRFVNPAGLLSIGDNLYAEGPNSGDPLNGVPGDVGFGTILHRALEGSNVDASVEITDQIVNQRYYQMNLRVFQTSDALVGRAIDLFS